MARETRIARARILLAIALEDAAAAANAFARGTALQDARIARRVLADLGVA